MIHIINLQLSNTTYMSYACILFLIIHFLNETFQRKNKNNSVIKTNEPTN